MGVCTLPYRQRSFGTWPDCCSVAYMARKNPYRMTRLTDIPTLGAAAFPFTMTDPDNNPPTKLHANEKAYLRWICAMACALPDRRAQVIASHKLSNVRNQLSRLPYGARCRCLIGLSSSGSSD
jgi:hypothetical protein